MKTRRTHNVSFPLVPLFALFAIASPALVACGDSSTGSDDHGLSSVELSSDSGSSDKRSSAAADSLNGSSRTMSSEATSSSSEEPFDPGEGNHAVRVSTHPADARIAIHPAKANAVADGESFTAWIELPAGAGGDTVVYRNVGWNDAARTASDTVTVADVDADIDLVDTVSVLRLVRPRIGDSFAKGDTVTVEFAGYNLPNDVDVVLCPDRACAQQKTVLSGLSAAGGTFEFVMPSDWSAGNSYYLKAIVDNNFWARAKDISVSDPVVDGGWTPVPLQSEITKALPMTGLVFWTNNYKSGYDDATALEFGYCYPAAVVTGKSSNGKIQYDWTSFENLLNKAKNRKHQMVVRIAYENPTDAAWDGVVGHTAVPMYIKNDSTRYDYHETTNTVYDNNVHYADWRSDELKWFTKQFLTDFAAKYDNDPRVAFLEIGFGHWSEYHIYGTTANLGVNFPSKAYQKEYALHADSTLKNLPWIIGIAAGDASNSPYKNDPELLALNYGMLDDSFMHGEHDISQGDGYNEKCWKALDYTNHWQTAANGGEISFYSYSDHPEKPYDHLFFLSPEGVHGVTWAQAAAKYHITFMLAGSATKGDYGTPDHFLQGALASGYKFRVTSYAFNGRQARATVKNEGVAPIYRDAYVAVGGVRSGTTLKGLLPGDSLTVTVNASANDLELTIESDHLVGRPIQYLADLN